ncbi:hypothetical protein B484DRAFT_401567 [Ochromonadaceae sp. CCMP2298]|nr:hypothetical protein B484DRAFT_401567 [Ochromonadaceae sp. CCMP2298]
MDFNEYGAITSLAFSEDTQFLLVGSEDGTLSVATDPEERWRALDAALQKSTLGV